jgi:hypothetical protein
MSNNTGYITLEDSTTTLSRNMGNNYPLTLAQYPRRMKDLNYTVGKAKKYSQDGSVVIS